MSAFFGPGGNSAEFYADGKKHTFEAPEWLQTYGLDAYEYEGGNGVNLSKDTALIIGEKAREFDIKMSLHAPYFISLSSVEEEKRKNSTGYILKSAQVAQYLNAEIIVIHAGSTAKLDREVALTLAKETLRETLETLKENGLYGIKLGIETMGKVNQLGTFDEVLSMCELDDTVVPVVDFGHMNAREQGGVFTVTDDYKWIFERIEKAKGAKCAETLHCHFSKIEYTKGGEKKHLTFEDELFGPDYAPLMKAIAELGISPTIICESAGTMAKDALEMKQTYLNFLK